MTAQVCLFADQFAEEYARSVVLNVISGIHENRVDEFKNSGLIFFRQLDAKYPGSVEWASIPNSWRIETLDERMARMNLKAAADLQALGGLGAVW